MKLKLEIINKEYCLNIPFKNICPNVSPRLREEGAACREAAAVLNGTASNMTSEEVRIKTLQGDRVTVNSCGA